MDENQQLSPADARAQLDVKTADKEWGTKVLAGEAEASAEYQRLTTAAAGGDRLDAVLAGGVAPEFEMSIGGELPTRNIASAVEDLKQLGLSAPIVIEAFRGSKITQQVMGQARQLQTERMADKDWTAKLLAGDVATRRELALLSIVLNSEIVEEAKP